MSRADYHICVNLDNSGFIKKQRRFNRNVAILAAMGVVYAVIAARTINEQQREIRQLKKELRS